MTRTGRHRPTPTGSAKLVTERDTETWLERTMPAPEQNLWAALCHLSSDLEKGANLLDQAADEIDRLSRQLAEALEALEDLVSDAEKQMANPSHHMPFSLPKARRVLQSAAMRTETTDEDMSDIG